MKETQSRGSKGLQEWSFVETTMNLEKARTMAMCFNDCKTQTQSQYPNVQN